jgi:cytochrome oxidase Cu insertion factor (SCO1/SenC/PrrC family)
MKTTAIPYVLSLVIALGGGVAAWRIWNSDHSTGSVGSSTEVDEDYVDPGPLTSFTLTTSSGGKLHSEDLKGQVWVASFFFTSCARECLAMNRELAALQGDPNFDEVKLVSITCDPATDTLETLEEYAQRFNADPERWYFCWERLGYVQKIGTDVLKLTVLYQRHAEHAALVDRDGKVVGYFNLTNPIEVVGLKQTLTRVLRAPAPVDEAPVDEAPVDEAPVDEAPGEQAASNPIAGPGA